MHVVATHDGEGLAGLGEHKARRWISWYCWVTLAMLAAAILTTAAALERSRSPDQGTGSR